ncbi:MAG: RsmD family RNA methyltransferase, partial [Alphaproteobacteria bacterium]|nr:RsmD family RNA methyltransferase [Alphaproteobacteria bacterium]
FAGSGAFGLECLSRYQGVQVLFTDNSPTSLQTIRSNLSLLGLGAIARIRKTDAMMAIPTYGGMVDLVFLDPPYAHPEMGLGFLKGLARVAKRGMIVIWEQDAQNAVAPNEKKWNIVRDKTYGRARFLILQKK